MNEVFKQGELPEHFANPDVEIYEDSETIIHEGNNDRDFFSLVRGQLNVFKAHHKVASSRNLVHFLRKKMTVTANKTFQRRADLTPFHFLGKNLTSGISLKSES